MTADELASAFWMQYSQRNEPHKVTVLDHALHGDTELSERLLRDQAVCGAIANVELEGFAVPQGFKDLAERYVNGDVEREALRDYCGLHGH